MKRLLGVIIVTFFMIGCASQTIREEAFYSYDFFRITKTDFDSVQVPMFNSFDTIKSYYNTLKLLEYESVEFGINWAQNDFHTFLTTSGGLSANEADYQISFLNSNGNTWLIFNDAEKGYGYWIFLYLEKM